MVGPWYCSGAVLLDELDVLAMAELELENETVLLLDVLLETAEYTGGAPATLTARSVPGAGEYDSGVFLK